MSRTTWTRLAFGLSLMIAPAFVGCGESAPPTAETTPAPNAPAAASGPATPAADAGKAPAADAKK